MFLASLTTAGAMTQGTSQEVDPPMPAMDPKEEAAQDLKMRDEVSQMHYHLITEGVRSLSQLSPHTRASLGGPGVRQHADPSLQ
jgi:hypothetical protein